MPKNVKNTKSVSAKISKTSKSVAKVTKKSSKKKIVAKKVVTNDTFAFATDFFKQRLDASKVYLLLRAAALSSNAVLNNKPALKKVNKETRDALLLVSNLARKEEKEFVKSLPKRLSKVVKRKTK